MTAPWEVTRSPPLADIAQRLRQIAVYGANAANHTTGGKSYTPQDFQEWHDAEAVMAAASALT